MSSLAAVKRLLRDEANKIARQEGQLERIHSDLDTLRTDEMKFKLATEQLADVLGILNALEGEGYKTFEDRISALITRGLTAVFNEPIEFKLVGKTHGDLSALEFKLLQDGLETDIIGAKGGGVIAIVGFLLRLLILLSIHPKLHDVMLLDETFAHLSDEYVPNLADLLRQLTDETGVQFILVTHQPLFAEVADVVYEVSMKDGQSIYRKAASAITT